MLDIISISLHLLRFDLWPKMWSILENDPCALEKVYSSAFGWNILKISVRLISYNVSFKTCVSLLIFCFDDLPIGVSGVLKSSFILGCSKITADGDCSHEIKRRLLLVRKVMTTLDSILKSRDITLSTKVHLVKAMVFPVVMYGCESWTIKRAEHWRFNAFELWFWRRLLRVPCTTRRSIQSILKEISPECSLEGLMLKLNSKTLATWWEELIHLKRPWCWERLSTGGEGDDRGQDGWISSPTQ